MDTIDAATFQLVDDPENSTLDERPAIIHPVHDTRSQTQPLTEFDPLENARFYPNNAGSIPLRPTTFKEAYLSPTLAPDEHVRLAAVWYHLQGLHEDAAAMRRIRDKVVLLESLIGWEYAICGIVSGDTFERIGVAGMPLAIIPRRESPCSHTLVQDPGSVLFLPDMSQDWRFEHAPCVVHDGLRSYAGTQLKIRIRGGQVIAIGSLCVAANTPKSTLSQDNFDLLVRFADMLVTDILSASAR